MGQLLANLTGAFALGWLTARLAVVGSPRAQHRALLLGTGLLGGWTTYSGLALQTLAVGDAEGFVAGFLLLAVSVAGGLVAAVAGLRLGGRTPPETDSRPSAEAS